MTWLALLLALFLEQMSFPALRGRIEAWAWGWPRWVRSRAAQAQAASISALAWTLVAVLGPAVLAQMLYGLLGHFLGWFWLLFVFYACLGFSAYIRQASALREAVEWRDTQTLQGLVAQQVPEAVAISGGPTAQALAASLMLAQRQILAVVAAALLGWMLGVPLFFVVLLWAVQAWRMSAPQAAQDAAASGAAPVRGDARWLGAIDTAAAWVTAVSLAVGSQFDAVTRALRRGGDASARHALDLLGDAAGAALCLPEDWMERVRDEDDVDAVTIEHLLRWEGLVWRALGVWLLVFAVLTALAW